jgi:hypothetical protein
LLLLISVFLYILKRSVPQTGNSLEASYQVQTFRFTENYLELEVDQQQSHYSWNTIKTVYKYPMAWLIAFSDMTGYFALPTKSLDRDLKKMIILKLKQQQQSATNV